MKKMTINELRKSQLEMLDQFDKVCRDIDIRYTLAGGSLLGAIRHNGYIPWDDDVDIMVPQPDYNKILECRNLFESERFIFRTPYDVNNPLPFTYIKMCDLSTKLIEYPTTKKLEYNVYIDIFPCQGLPTDEKKNACFFRKGYALDKLFQVLKLAKYNKNYGNIFRRIIWSVIYLFSKIKNPLKIINKINKLASTYFFDNSDFVGNMFCGQGKKERMHKKAFELSEHEFEGRKLKILTGYDEYLTNLYGDYMKYPPKEQQVLKHDCLAYKID